jgi:protein-tyrosine phosphatase
LALFGQTGDSASADKSQARSQAPHNVETSNSISVLFVCMGNICRSPTAEGVVRKLMSDHAPALGVELELDSAGTHSYHVGHPPDRRAQTAAQARGVDLSTIRARRVVEDDFTRFNLILAMDEDNLAELEAMRPAEATAQVRLLLDYAPANGMKEVPDPYYGGPNGFEQVLDLVEAAASGLMAEIAAGRG